MNQREAMAQLVADVAARLRYCNPPNEAMRSHAIMRANQRAEMIFPQFDDGFVEQPEFDDGFVEN